MEVLLGVAGYLAACALVPLLLVLPHELGHGLAALAFGAKGAEVDVGAEPRPLSLQLGRLRLRVRPFNTWRHLWYGSSRWDGIADSRVAGVAASAGGPLVSLALLPLYVAAAFASGRFVAVFFWALAIGAAWTFLVTALPIRYGRFFGPYSGKVSDGYRIRQALTRS